MSERVPLIERVTSDALRPDEVVVLREIFDVAWGDGDADDSIRSTSR